MILHEDQQLFQQAINATSQKLRIPEMYIEKDYWVTVALKQVFCSEVGKYTVFKGGTALGKCNKLIERFSEDIDLVVMHDSTDSDHQLKKRIKTIGEVVSGILPEFDLKGITHKRGMIRKTAHSFTQIIPHNSQQTRDKIIVEATWLGYFEPYSKGEVASFIYEMMASQGQYDLATKYDLHPFEVNVLDPKRTICEKIMSLVRFSHTEQAVEDLKFKIRHTYDLCVLLKNPELNTFLHSSEFEEMLLKVAHDDVKSFKNNNAWLEQRPVKALIFDLNTWDKLRQTYQGVFRDLVYGYFPSEEEISNTLQEIKKRLSTINWHIQF